MKYTFEVIGYGIIGIAILAISIMSCFHTPGEEQRKTKRHFDDSVYATILQNNSDTEFSPSPISIGFYKKSQTIGNAEIFKHVVKGCEYIGRLEGSNADFLAHKGNCVFCAKRHEDIIRKIIAEILKHEKEKDSCTHNAKTSRRIQSTGRDVTGIKVY